MFHTAFFRKHRIISLLVFGTAFLFLGFLVSSGAGIECNVCQSYKEEKEGWAYGGFDSNTNLTNPPVRVTRLPDNDTTIIHPCNNPTSKQIRTMLVECPSTIRACYKFAGELWGLNGNGTYMINIKGCWDKGTSVNHQDEGELDKCKEIKTGMANEEQYDSQICICQGTETSPMPCNKGIVRKGIKGLILALVVAMLKNPFSFGSP